MSNIYINWKLIFENKKIQYTGYILISILIIILLYSYTTLFNGVKYKIAKIYTFSILKTEANNALSAIKIELKNDYNNKLKELEEEYIKSLEKTNTNYDLIIETYKNQIEKEYRDSFLVKDITYGISDLQKLEFKNEIYELLKNDGNLVLDNISILSKLERSYNINTELINLIEEEIEKEYIEKNINIDAEIKATTLEYEVIRRTGEFQEIKILNKSKLENLLPFGITFPSLFSYKLNGIGLLPGYFDLHYGVDYRTRPKVYIDMFYFNNKKGTVLISDKNKSIGYRLVIGNIDNNGSERFEYLHLNNMYVEQGDIIKEGTKILETGKTGIGTGPHLHFAYIKDGFLVPYDWGLDIDNKFVLQKMNIGLSINEIDKIIQLGKTNSLNMLHITFAYLDIADRNINDLDLLVKGFIEAEKDNIYRIGDVLSMELLKGKYDNIRNTTNNIINNSDKFHQIKKEIIMKFLLENRNELESYISFERNKLGNSYQTKKTNSKIDYGICNGYKSNTFDIYKNTIKNTDISFLSEEHIKNINFMIPLILNNIKELDVSGKLNNRFKYTNIHDCDILFLELGKWYQETSFNMTTNNKYGIFQIMSKDYPKDFPNDIGKDILSIEQYNTKIQDTLNFSLGKMSYLTNISRFSENIKDKDYILKFWLWSYHGIVGAEPNKNAYVSNNLIYSELPLRDISATRKTAIRDGAYTIAVKLYLNK